MKEAFISHVTAGNAAGGTGGHWRLRTVLLISVASLLPSVNDKDWLCAIGFSLFFKIA